MKKLLFLLLLMGGMTSYGQNIDSVTLSKMKLNFVVPDMPAFKTLGSDPSNLLRPSTPMPLAVALSEFYQDDKLVVPRAFALEIAPAQLINARKDISEIERNYARHGVWNSFRVSLGSARDTSFATTGRKLALGFRLNVINKGEMATDREELKAIVARLRRFRVDTREAREAFAENHLEEVKVWMIAFNPSDSIAIKRATVLDSLVDWDLAMASRLRKDTALERRLTTFIKSTPAAAFDTWFAARKLAYKKEHWNDTKLDVALSIMGAARDSLVSNVRFAEASFWGTLAVETGKAGQTLIGVNANLAKDSLGIKGGDNFFSIAVPVRYLVGTNRIKGFAELQYKYTGQFEAHNAFLNLGAEINPIDGFWLNVYGGVERNTKMGTTSFITNLDIKVTLPEKFSLF